MTARVKTPRVVLAVALTVVSVGPAVAMGTGGGAASTVTRWTGTMPDDWIKTPATAAEAVPAAAPAIEAEPMAAAVAPVEAPAPVAAPAPAPKPEPIAAAPAKTGSSVAGISAPKGPSPEWIRQQNEASEALRKEQLSRAGDAPAEAAAAAE